MNCLYNYKLHKQYTAFIFVRFNKEYQKIERHFGVCIEYRAGRVYNYYTRARPDRQAKADRQILCAAVYVTGSIRKIDIPPRGS